VLPGDTTLSLLPPWHIYQRTVSYYLLSVGCQEVFSNIRSFAKDLTAYPPDHFICVPLVLDTLYNKVGAPAWCGWFRCVGVCGRRWDVHACACRCACMWGTQLCPPPSRQLPLQTFLRGHCTC
jgi:hypothetical protein